jgi:hypothetical protein
MLSCGHEISIGYFGKPRAPGIMPALLATYTGDFDTVDDARKAAIADADNPKIGPVDSITIDPIGDRWVKGESLVRKRAADGNAGANPNERLRLVSFSAHRKSATKPN